MLHKRFLRPETVTRLSNKIREVGHWEPSTEWGTQTAAIQNWMRGTQAGLKMHKILHSPSPAGAGSMSTCPAKEGTALSMARLKACGQLYGQGHQNTASNSRIILNHAYIFMFPLGVFSDFVWKFNTRKWLSVRHNVPVLKCPELLLSSSFSNLHSPECLSAHP